MIYVNHNGVKMRYCEKMSDDKAKVCVAFNDDENFIEFDIDDLLALHDIAQEMRIKLICNQETIDRRIAKERAYLAGTEEVDE